MLKDALTVKEVHDPANLQATYRLGMNDLFSTLLVPGLTAMAAKLAPNVALRFLHTLEINKSLSDAYSDLDAGTIDMTIIQDFDTPSRFVEWKYAPDTSSSRVTNGGPNDGCHRRAGL
jgi:hypothetical protein